MSEQWPNKEQEIWFQAGVTGERERIIKELKANEHIWRERVVLNGLIALIKGETNE